MKNKINYLLFFLPLVVVFSGCGDEYQTRPEEGGTSLSISSVTTNSEAVISTVDTRSVTPLTNGSIGVFRLSSPDYAAQSNVQYTYGSAWTAATQIYLTRKSALVCAYYPYSATIGNNPAAIPLTAQIYSSAADLCYARTIYVSSGNPDANFTMNRAYAKMTFTITRDASYAGTGNISTISVENSNIIAQNNLDISTSTYSSTPAAKGSISTTTNVTLPAAGGGSSTVEMLVPPTINAITGDVLFNFIIDGNIVTGSLPSATNNLTSLTAGRNYTVSVTIKNNALILNSISTTDWNNQPVTNTASATLIGNRVESNCYIVPPGAKTYIPVSRVSAAWTQINGSAYTLPSTCTVGLLWTSNVNRLSPTGSVASITYNKNLGYIEVTAGSAEGNSVIAIYDGTTILWSWHIWVTDQPASETVDGRIWMDRNLGATDVATGTTDVRFGTCGGLYYQWGRKDPFPGNNGTLTGTTPAILIYNTSGLMTNTSITYEGFTPTATGTTNDVIKRISVTTSPLSYATQCSYSIKYPLLFLSDWAGSTATAVAGYTAAGGMSSWGGENGDPKSIFDPCPAGWRVPSGRTSSPTFVSPWSSWTTGSSFVASTNAAVFWPINRNVFRYPANGFRPAANGAISSVGSSGFYWSASQNGGEGFHLGFSSGSGSPSSGARANGLTVRCVQE